MVTFMPVIFVAFVVLVVVLAILGHRQTQQRREALRQFAHQHGLAFDEGKDHSIDNQFGDAFKFLKQGDNRYAYNRLSGTWRGREMLAFDYHYQTHTRDNKGKRRTHHHHLSAVVLTTALPLRPLAIREEGLFDKLGAFFGWEDINFESAEFSRSFHVYSPDRRWAYDVLHPRAMQLLLDRPRFTLAMDGRRVVAWRGRTFTPEQFAEAADLLCNLLDMLPEYVRQQQQQAVR